MGIATTGGSAFGAVLAPPLIVAASHLAGWRGAFIVTGIIGVLWLLTWFLLFRRPEESRFPNPAEREMILAGRGPGRGPHGETLADGHAAEPRGCVGFASRPASCSTPSSTSTCSGSRSTSTRNAARRWRRSEGFRGSPFSRLALHPLLGGSLSDWLVRRGWGVGRTRKTIMGCAAFLTPMSILALYAPDSLWAVTLLGVLMFAHGFWMTNYMTLIGDVFPAGTVATVVGLSGTFGGFGGFLSSLAIGRIIEADILRSCFRCLRAALSGRPGHHPGHRWPWRTTRSIRVTETAVVIGRHCGEHCGIYTRWDTVTGGKMAVVASRFSRGIYGGLGWCAVALGFAGVFLPGPADDSVPYRCLVLFRAKFAAL